MNKYQGFIDQCSEKYGGLAKKIADFMEDRKISSLMGDDLYEYFGTKTAVTKTQFYVRRNAIIDFVKFTNDPNKDKIINRISNVSQVQLAKRIDENSSAYKSLDEVLDLLNQIVLEKKLHSTDATPLQSIAILMWLSYNNEDIVEFKASDIESLKNLNDKYKEILKSYRNIIEHCTIITSKDCFTFKVNKINSYFSMYQIIIQNMLKEQAKKVWGDKYNIYFDSSEKGYSTKLCIALNLPYAYSSRFNNVTIEKYAVKAKNSSK